MKKKLSIKCPAKINLSLDVVNRREDGYHNLEMIMHTIKLFDALTITSEESEKSLVTVISDSPYAPSDDGNLCAKAARLFLDHAGITADITIDIKKKIPVGAGLGGGSSDAAGTLSALNTLLGNPLSKGELALTAKSLGADVPFFLRGGCMLAEGIGEVLTPLPTLKDVIFLVAKPKFGVSTPWVYKNLVLSEKTPHPNTMAVIEAIRLNDINLLAKSAGNTLESVTLNKYPEIKKYKQIMRNYGAIYSLMSGSGSAVFGVFDNPLKAKKAFEKFKGMTNQVYLV